MRTGGHDEVAHHKLESFRRRCAGTQVRSAECGVRSAGCRVRFKSPFVLFCYLQRKNNALDELELLSAAPPQQLSMFADLLAAVLRRLGGRPKHLDRLHVGESHGPSQKRDVIADQHRAFCVACNLRRGASELFAVSMVL